MYQKEIETEILSRVRALSSDDQCNVLNYLEHFPRPMHSTRRYRRRAMKQIREALNNQR